MTKVLFSAADVRPDLQQAARALYENGWLGAYYTTFALAERGLPIRTAEFLDRWLGRRMAAQLRRRAILEFPADRATLFPWWEIPRTLVSRGNLNPGAADALFLRSIIGFDRHVARRVNRYSAVYAGNGAAYETFRAARKRGIPCIYSVRSFHPAFEDEMEKREAEKFPELRTGTSYGSRSRHVLSERRQKEWELADLVVMPSDVCRESYSAQGLDTTKVKVIPLGFPEIGPPVRAEEMDRSGPLKILWAGTFSLRKGGHYFLQAIKLIPREIDLEVVVYGKNEMPGTTSADSDGRIVFRPTLPRSELLKQYRRAHVAVLPTLSDAYGMTVTEAMSQGLPVITTASAGAAIFIKPGENGLLIPPGDAEALANALSWCGVNRSALSQMGTRARETAGSWQWHHYRSSLAGLLAGIVGEHCRPPASPGMVRTALR